MIESAPISPELSLQRISVSPSPLGLNETNVSGVPIPEIVELTVPEYVIPSGRMSVIYVPLPLVVNAAFFAVSRCIVYVTRSPITASDTFADLERFAYRLCVSTERGGRRLELSTRISEDPSFQVVGAYGQPTRDSPPVCIVTVLRERSSWGTILPELRSGVEPECEAIVYASGIVSYKIDTSVPVGTVISVISIVVNPGDGIS